MYTWVDLLLNLYMYVYIHSHDAYIHIYVYTHMELASWESVLTHLSEQRLVGKWSDMSDNDMSEFWHVVTNVRILIFTCSEHILMYSHVFRTHSEYMRICFWHVLTNVGILTFTCSEYMRMCSDMSGNDMTTSEFWHSEFVLTHLSGHVRILTFSCHFLTCQNTFSCILMSVTCQNKLSCHCLPHVRRQLAIKSVIGNKL